ncbi:hypothetical protein COCNU_01G016940 [Cocos nucifera]|uniref:Uncharacterized protein n=1 Tax=Cocos nucifera TaxID=13894 RepID=A0A8K0MVT5_COCNU|nr:hypothetical protein COCNU_01G016940 [Cocos nucifera]
MGDPSVGTPESRIELTNPSMEVTNMLVDSGVELMVEMNFLTLPTEVPIEVTAMRVEGSIGMSKPKTSMRFAKVIEAIPIESCFPIEAQVEISRILPSTLTAVETLRFIVEFLRSHLSPDERHALEGEGAQRRMEGALRSLALLGHNLASFIGVIPGASALELIKVKEEIGQSKLGFSAGFERCKEMAQACLPLSNSVHIGSLLVDSLDDNLRTIIHDYLDRFAKSSDMPVIANRELKELLSEQSLFNMDISQTSLEGADLNLSQLSGPKIFQKRRMETVGGKSAQAWVRLLPASLVFRSKDPEPPTVKGFEIVQLPHGFDLPILEGGQGSPIEFLFIEAVLNLPAPDIFDLFLEEHPIKVMEISVTASDKAKSVEILKTSNASTAEEQPTTIVRPSRTTTARMGLHDSILEDYKLASEDDVRAQIEVTTVKVIEKFRTSKEYEDEQDMFVVDTYDEGRPSVRREVASHYPGLNLNFLDEDLEATNIDVMGVRSDPKDVL